MALAQTYATFPALARGQPTVLKTDPKRGKIIYGAGKMVIIRDIEPAADGKINVQTYSEHLYPVTAVEMSPSGAYMASGDKSGVLRICKLSSAV